MFGGWTCFQYSSNWHIDYICTWYRTIIVWWIISASPGRFIWQKQTTGFDRRIRSIIYKVYLNEKKLVKAYGIWINNNSLPFWKSAYLGMLYVGWINFKIAIITWIWGMHQYNMPGWQTGDRWQDTPENDTLDNNITYYMCKPCHYR